MSGATRGEDRAWRAPEDEIERLLALVHRDPHAILGAHPGASGVAVRVFRPEAERVVALPDGGEPVELARRHPAGFFEGLLAVRGETFAYRCEVHYPGGAEYTGRVTGNTMEGTRKSGGAETKWRATRIKS